MTAKRAANHRPATRDKKPQPGGILLNRPDRALGFCPSCVMTYSTYKTSLAVARLLGCEWEPLASTGAIGSIASQCLAFWTG